MRNRSGAGFLEILFITALLLLFGVTTYTLVSVGGSSYQRVMDKRDVNVSARVALSYLTTQLRMNDVAGGVEIRTLENGVQCLVLKDAATGGAYETLVYCYNGNLWEAPVETGTPVDLTFGSPIAPLRDLSFEYSESTNTLRLCVTAGEGTMRREMETLVHLQSGADTGETT